MTTARRFALVVSLAVSSFSGAQEMRSVFADVSIDAATGTYTIRDRTNGWRLAGTVGQAVTGVRNREGGDRGGPFTETSFEWTLGTPVRGTIRVYRETPSILFRLTYLESRADGSVVFPRLTNLPAGLRGFSYQDQAFSPAAFRLADTSTPWLLFDDRARAMVFSPASQFLTAKVVGDGKTSIGATLNDRVRDVPKGTSQDSLLVFGGGIGRAWDDWGTALRALYDRSVSAPNDPIVQKYGYWTDNGADYYYDFDPAKGYAGTLLAVRDHYRDAGLPLGYLQLDSWWYRKLTDSISGEASPGLKNPKLPPSEWNRYGGVLEYRAASELFPNGLAAFRKDLGLPFVVHGRWIDAQSPLRERYRISGVGPVDPRYWNDAAGYLAASGASCYEQDWIENIYAHSPEMASTLGVADAFADGMASAMKRRGLTLQYCMATPRFVLQGVKYSNLTTIRTAPDRFEPKKWAPFILGAPLARGVGAVPWSDVFRSGETGNAIVATLSAGPVGNGDAIGKEDGSNILKVARPDGLIVKPDAPLMATDATYLSGEVRTGAPFVASTLTDHDGLRTRYLFAFPRDAESRSTGLTMRSLGATDRCYLADLTTGEGRAVDPDDEIALTIGDEGFVYRMAAPLTRTGVAVLGDWGKFVPTGRARVEAMDDRADGVRVRVAFAKGETPITLEGFCERPPKVRATKGGARLLRYDAASGRFAVEVSPEGERAELVLDGR